MSDGTERIRSSGAITLSERLERLEHTIDRNAAKVERWQEDHQKKDDSFQDEIMASVNQRKGNAQVWNIAIVVLTAIASICSIAGMFINRH